ncbi:hypothetical protein F0U61_43305 [Archangium violaceum]|nr:hypothetical protein F0U61_43305 [Archangium violaceum]
MMDPGSRGSEQASRVAGTWIEQPPAMTHETPRHPKLHGKAFLRDLLFSMGVFLAIVLWTLVLGFGALWLTSYVHRCPSRQETARQDLASIQSALRLYHSRYRRFPSTEEGMRELVNRQGLEQVPHDPWGLPYHYELHEGLPRVWSLGADGAPGGEGEDEDIVLEQH